MAYDGMYGELSTRGTANQILDQILQVQDEVETTQDEIEATAQLVDQNSQEAVAARDAAIAARDAANASADSASLSADSATLASGNAAGSAVEANNSAAAAAISEANAAQSAQDAEDAAASVIIGGPRLMSIAAAVMAVNDMLIADSTSTMTSIATGSTGRALLAAATAAAARTTIGATSVGSSLLTAATAAAARTTLGSGTTGDAVFTAVTGDDARSALDLTRPFMVNTATVDFNTLVNRGWQPNLYSASSPNAPTTYEGGNVVYWYVHTAQYSSAATVLQVAYPYGTSSGATGRIAWRNLYQGNWTPWQYVAKTDDLKLPILTGNNETFVFEGGTTQGWNLTSMSVTAPTSGGSVFTKTIPAASGTCQATRPVVYPQNSGDYILFGKFSIANSATNLAAISIISGSSAQSAALWINSVDANTGTSGGLSIRGTVGGVPNTQSLGTFTLSNGIEFALQYDNKHQTLTCWLKQSSGSWTWAGRVGCDRHTLDLNIAFGTVAALNTAITIEHLSIAAPNIVIWGDSIAEGKNLYSPNPSLGLTNWTSHWASYINLYRGLRNNLPVVKGVGSRSSLVMESNLSEIESLGAQVVFFHASSNDQVAGVSQSARTTSMQNQIDRLTRKGAQVVILNAMQGTPTYSGNPALRDYTDLWWSTSLKLLKSVYSTFDIAAAIGLNGFQDPALTQSDGIHPNPAGYAVIGGLINQASSLFSVQRRASITPIVGTVITDSGRPTGAIMERGSNANGDYIRYADGTQICWKTFSATTAISIAAGSIFLSGALDAGNWAATFSATPVRSLFSDGSAWQFGSTGLSTTGIGTFQLVRHISTASSTYNVSVIGVGRWF